jgi:hypothetical protein
VWEEDTIASGNLSLQELVVMLMYEAMGESESGLGLRCGPIVASWNILDMSGRTVNHMLRPPIA